MDITIIRSQVLLGYFCLCLACAEDSTTSSMPDLSVTPDASIDAALLQDAELVVDADTSSLPPPNWMNPMLIDGPQIDGVVIQPALTFDGSSTLHLAFSVLNPERLGIYTQTYNVETGIKNEPVNLVAEPVGIHNEPDICSLSSGGAAVVWSVDTQDGSRNNLQIRYRVLDATGTPINARDQIVETDVDGNHWLGSVTCNGRNEFVIVGARSDPNDTFGVFAQRFDHMGTSIGMATQVNDDPEGGQVYPVITALPDGVNHRYAIAYEDRPSESNNVTRVAIRFFDDNLQPTTSVFAVSADGIEATQPSIVHTGIEHGVVVAATVEGERIGLFRVDPTDQSSRYTRGSDERLSYNTDIGAFDGDPVYSFLRGSGREVDVVLGRHDFDVDGLSETLLAQGWYPPYQTALAQSGSEIALAVTERLNSDRFQLQLYRFSP